MLTLDELCGWLNITERHARKLHTRERPVGHASRRGAAFFQLIPVAASMNTTHPKTVIYLPMK
jgi:hypothetical protein